MADEDQEGKHETDKTTQTGGRGSLQQQNVIKQNSLPRLFPALYF